MKSLKTVLGNHLTPTRPAGYLHSHQISLQPGKSPHMRDLPQPAFPRDSLAKAAQTVSLDAGGRGCSAGRRVKADSLVRRAADPSPRFTKAAAADRVAQAERKGGLVSRR